MQRRVLPPRQGQHREQKYIIVKRIGAQPGEVEVLLVLRGKGCLVEGNSKMPEWAADLIKTPLGQQFLISDPRLVPMLSFAEFIVESNRNRTVLEEKKVLPQLMGIHVLNLNQTVVLENGAITLKVKKLAPKRRTYGQVTLGTSIVFSAITVDDEDDSDT